MEISENHLIHLQQFLENNFSLVAFDQIVRQMGKHKISSKYTRDRLNEVFLNILNQERENYRINLESEVRSLTNQKKIIENRIVVKQKRIERHIDRALEENRFAHQKLAQLKSLQAQNQHRFEEEQQKYDNHFKNIQQEIQNLNKPISVLRGRILELRNEINEMRDSHLNYISNGKILINEQKRTYMDRYNQIKKEYMNTPAITEYDQKLFNEKTKTLKQSESINTVFEYILNLQKKHNDPNPQLFKTDDFSPAGFRLVINQLARNIKQNSTVEACKLFGVEDGKLESVVSRLNEIMESKSTSLREKYRETIDKQQKRIAKLQQQLAIAQKELYSLSKPSSDTKMINEITVVHKSLAENMNATDQKMSKLQKLTFKN